MNITLLRVLTAYVNIQIVVTVLTYIVPHVMNVAQIVAILAVLTDAQEVAAILNAYIVSVTSVAHVFVQIIVAEQLAVLHV